MSEKTLPMGGEFLLRDGEPEFSFTPEDFTDEQKMIKQTTLDFVEGEIMPKLDEIEKKDEKVVRTIFKAAGELGLLGTDVPEEFGGIGLDKISTAVLTEAFGGAGSIAVSEGAHTGIGTLPIVYYGNKEQQAKYLPGLAAGTDIGAYCLTESGAGSDAIGGCRTKAVLSEDGKHYILNGEKIFITNGGWADTFVVLAKIDGEQFSAFIVERAFNGVSNGAEEAKMGIQGSSTTTVVFEDTKVPVENLLYKAGQGHHIAMNVLNIGRYKLGCACIGGAKSAIKMCVKYAKDRSQFGKPIIEFGAIREKIAKMASKVFVCESVIYRNVGLIDQALAGTDHSDPDYPQKATEAIREYALECAISKVHGSEVVDYIVDENVQIHGGYGYVGEYLAERAYRDARINRIFEGTNEINRLLIPGELLKKAMKGKLPLLAAGQKLMGDIMEYSPMMVDLPDTPLAYEEHIIGNCKKAVIFASGVAVQRFMQKLQDEQEVLMRVADMIIETFALESALLRCQKAIAADNPKAQLYIDLFKMYMDEVMPKMHAWANEALAQCAEGEELHTQFMAMRKLMKYNLGNTIAIRSTVADIVTEKGGYPLD